MVSSFEERKKEEDTPVSMMSQKSTKKGFINQKKKEKCSFTVTMETFSLLFIVAPKTEVVIKTVNQTHELGNFICLKWGLKDCFLLRQRKEGEDNKVFGEK